MNEFLLLLLSMSLSGTLPALLLFLLRPLLKRNLSRAWMYYIWCIVALRMLLPFAPRQNLVGSLLADPSAAMRQLSALSAFTEDTAPAALPANQVLNNAVSKSSSEAAASCVFLRKLYAASHAVTAQEITACYASVCRELSVRRPPRLLASPETDTAMLAGMLRPAVILPAVNRTGSRGFYPEKLP